ncbi:MAG: alpha/beta fold hydrolase [Ruegeria sp.]|uniref:alpha/beta fold hydrolase n=1 Tax=Ruegeria sp. TaxID=1879320 RepID=UPI00349ED183
MASGILILILVLLVFVIGAAALPYWAEARRRPMDEWERRDAPGTCVPLSQGVTHYQWHGAVRGPVAVCVHGLSTPSFVWNGLARALGAMGYRVLTYDLYGRGYSDRPEGSQNDDFFIKQLEDLLDDQEIEEDFTLFGYSMGGAIATVFAAKHPNRVRHLVLLASSGMVMTTDRATQFIRQKQGLGDWLMLALFPGRHRRGTEAERALPSSVPDIVDLQQRELHYRGFVPAVLSSLRGILSRELQDEHRTIHRAGVPVLAIWAREDDVIPLSAMGRLTEWSRDAWQEVIEDAGHGMTYTHTDQIAAILSERLRDGLN